MTNMTKALPAAMTACIQKLVGPSSITRLGAALNTTCENRPDTCTIQEETYLKDTRAFGKCKFMAK